MNDQQRQQRRIADQYARSADPPTTDLLYLFLIILALAIGFDIVKPRAQPIHAHRSAPVAIQTAVGFSCERIPPVRKGQIELCIAPLIGPKLSPPPHVRAAQIPEVPR